MTRRRVVHAAKYYPPVPGGMETVVGDLCRGTADEWDVQVVAAHDRAETVVARVDDVTVTRTARHGVALADWPVDPVDPFFNVNTPEDAAEADRIADAFTEMRRQEYRLYPDAHATVDALRARGVKLALVTNGASEMQRAKIERFDLEHRFDHIQIEGEFGQGKPELAVYRHALERLGCEACDAWMVGDNYEWEVVAPQKLGMAGIWYDPFGAGVPAHATALPTRIITRLSELVE